MPSAVQRFGTSLYSCKLQALVCVTTFEATTGYVWLRSAPNSTGLPSLAHALPLAQPAVTNYVSVNGPASMVTQGKSDRLKALSDHAACQLQPLLLVEQLVKMPCCAPTCACIPSQPPCDCHAICSSSQLLGHSHQLAAEVEKCCSSTCTHAQRMCLVHCQAAAAHHHCRQIAAHICCSQQPVWI